MSDINAVAIVSYVKHWDNDTKGTMEFPDTDLARAVELAQAQLVDDARADGIFWTNAARLYTITKVAYGVPSNWLGVR